jgi:hypothetical protein
MSSEDLKETCLKTPPSAPRPTLFIPPYKKHGSRVRRGVMLQHLVSSCFWNVLRRSCWEANKLETKGRSSAFLFQLPRLVYVKFGLVVLISCSAIVASPLASSLEKKLVGSALRQPATLALGRPLSDRAVRV